jgi:hypothetical protein
MGEKTCLSQMLTIYIKAIGNWRPKGMRLTDNYFQLIKIDFNLRQ